MLLACQMFELRNACIGMIIGVVDRAHRLVLRGVGQMLVLKTQ